MEKKPSRLRLVIPNFSHQDDPFQNEQAYDLSSPIAQQPPISTSKESGRNGTHAFQSTKPNILLETISAKQTMMLLISTWGAFFFSIVVTIYTSFSQKEVLEVPLLPCRVNSTVQYETFSAFCLGPGESQFMTLEANFTVPDDNNLFGSIALQFNFRENKLFDEDSLLSYEVNVQTCLKESCQNKEYYPVMNMEGEALQVLGSKSNGYYGVIFDTYQNQPTLQSIGVIGGYWIKIGIQYDDETQEQFSLTNAYSLSFAYTNISANTTFWVFELLIMIFILLYGIKWLYVCAKHNPDFNEKLSERKWLTIMWVGCILFLNPLNRVLVFLGASWITTGTTCSSLLISSAGFLLLMLGWLFYADSLTVYISRRKFYIPKMIFLIILFCAEILVIVVKIPASPLLSHGRFEAQTNWPQSEFLLYTSSQFCLMVLLFVACIWYVRLIWKTGSRLSKLPYVRFRYKQLTFRVFVLQSSLLLIAFLLQYIITTIQLWNKYSMTDWNWTDFSSAFSSVIYTPNQELGRHLLTTVFVYSFLVVHLPPQARAMLLKPRTQYFLTEKQLWLRNRSLQRQSGERHFGTRRFHPSNEQHDLFVVETALHLFDLAWQAYLDPPSWGCRSASSNPEIDGWQDVNKHNYEFIDHLYSKKHETHCLIARHQIKNRLVISFRGTANWTQMKNNLRFKQHQFNLDLVCLKSMEKSKIRNAASVTDEGKDETLENPTSGVGSNTRKGSIGMHPENLEQKHLDEQNILEVLESMTKEMIKQWEEDHWGVEEEKKEVKEPSKRRRLFSLSKLKQQISRRRLSTMIDPVEEADSKDGNSESDRGAFSWLKFWSSKEDTKSDDPLETKLATVEEEMEDGDRTDQPADSDRKGTRKHFFRDLFHRPRRSFSIQDRKEDEWDVQVPSKEERKYEEGAPWLRPKIFLKSLRPHGPSKDVQQDEAKGQTVISQRPTLRQLAPYLRRGFSSSAAVEEESLENSHAAEKQNQLKLRDFFRRSSKSEETEGEQKSPRYTRQPSLHWLQRLFSKEEEKDTTEQSSVRESSSKGHVFTFQTKSSSSVNSTIEHTSERKHNFLKELQEATQMPVKIIEEVGSFGGDVVMQTTEAVVHGFETGAQRFADGAEQIGANKVYGLNKIMYGYVHEGFWDAYSQIRTDLHEIVCQAMLEKPCDLYITGHSLGGALSTFAAMDLAKYMIPKLEGHLERRRTVDGPALQEKIKLAVYTFGSPRVGNKVFSKRYKELVPNTFTIQVDGDLVTGIPKAWYRHVGKRVVIDGNGAGTIIIDPSFVERRFKTKHRTGIAAHFMTHYKKGLEGLKNYEDTSVKQLVREL